MLKEKFGEKNPASETVGEDDRIFKASKTQLNLMLQKYAEEAGGERICFPECRRR